MGRFWGGVVITEAGTAPRVAALVCVAAAAPEDNQSIAEVAAAAAPPIGSKATALDGAGFVLLTCEGALFGEPTRL